MILRKYEEDVGVLSNRLPIGFEEVLRDVNAVHAVVVPARGELLIKNWGDKMTLSNIMRVFFLLSTSTGSGSWSTSFINWPEIPAKKGPSKFRNS